MQGGGLAYYLVEPFFPKMEEPGLIVGVDTHAHKRGPLLLVHANSSDASLQVGVGADIERARLQSSNHKHGMLLWCPVIVCIRGDSITMLPLFFMAPMLWTGTHRVCCTGIDASLLVSA